MKKLDVMNKATRALHKVKFGLKKHSPEILMVAGVGGVVVSGVLACKATLKVNAVLDESKTNIDKIHKAAETGKTEAGEDYTKEDEKKEMTIVYAQTGVKLAKMYAPSVALGALSITAIVAGNRILHKRNVALAAAYTAVDKSFKEYRGRVVERFGEALDKELKYNIKAKEVEEIVTNEDGTETVVKTIVEDVVEDKTYLASPYAFFFDETCEGHTKDPEFNKNFLIKTQAFANEKLKRQGYLFLNDVLKMLGIPLTKAGYQVGWIYDEKNPIGDNFVDFGIFNVHREANRNFVNGWERSILLDFNVDGNILGRLKL